MTSSNGQAGRFPSSMYPTPRMTLNDDQFGRLVSLWEEVVGNVTTASRGELFRQLFDPRRDVDDECGYPRSETGRGFGAINPELFRTLYEREAIATRVVQVLPKESWQVTPIIHEDENPDRSTPFEEAWDELGQQLRGEQCWFNDTEGSPVWEHLRRVDILSGIGHFGVLLIGIDDGLNLDQPVEGVVTTDPTGKGEAWTSTENPSPSGDVFGPASKIGSNPGKPQWNTAYRSIPTAEVRDRPLAEIDTRPNSPTKGLPIFNAKREAYVDFVTNDYGLSSLPGAGLGTAGSAGTDAQYVGVQLSPSEYPSAKRSKKQRRVLFLRAYDESLVQIVQYEANVRNPRFGMPVMYRITLNDPREQHSGIGLPYATVRVHWSRVIHVADNLGSPEIFGVPRMRPVLNRLLDLRKIYGASAEGFWKAAFMILKATTHPQLGGDVKINQQAMKDLFENMMNGLQRYGVFQGMDLGSVAPIATDPTNFLAAHIQAICIQLGIPQRVFMGSERGELASSQDDQAWNDRVRERQKNYITPRIIVPFIDRLIAMGVLPEPEEYRVTWENMDSLSDLDKATIASTKTAAIAQYVQSGAEAILPPEHFLEKVMGFERADIEQIMDDAQKAQEEQQSQDEALAQEHGMVPEIDGWQHKEEVQPPTPMTLKPGEKAVHPETGQEIAQGNKIPLSSRPHTSRNQPP